MDETAPIMPPDALLEVVSALEGFDPLPATGRLSFAVRRDVICHVGRFPEGVRVSYRELAFRMGRSSDRQVSEAITDLTARGVLVVEQEAAGRRPRWLRVNPFVGDWKATRWRYDVRLLAERVFVPRSVPGTSAVEPRPGARHKLQPTALVPRHRARQYADPEATTGRGTTPAKPLVVVPHSAFAGSAPSAPTEGTEVAEDAEPAEFKRLAKTVLAHVLRRPRLHPQHVNGRRQRAQLRELYDEHGLQPILDLIPSIPGELEVPKAIDWLADELAGGAFPLPEPPEAVSTPAYDAATAAARLAALDAEEARLLSYVDDEDDPHLVRVRSERAAVSALA